MMKKIIALLMALSLLLLSVITVSGKSNKPTNYPGQSKAADLIVEAIKANDADKIVAMFNAESQDGIKKLNQKIENFISTIGSDIISYDSTGSYQTDKIDVGYSYSETGFYITIITEKNIYDLTVKWITKCSSNSEKIGIRYINLLLINDKNEIVSLLGAITLPYEKNVTYKKELALLDDKDIVDYNHWGYDSIIFTSSDESVLTVTSEGVVTTNKPGTANVTKTLTNSKTGNVWQTEYEITVKLSFWQKIIWYCLFGFLWY